MIDYTTINNQQLRELVMNSVSIQSLAEEEKATLMQQIANLPQKGQEELMQTLMKEAQRFEHGQVLDQQQQAQMQEDLLQVIKLKNDMEKDVRVEQEKIEIGQSSTLADNLLNHL
ncbi:MAG: hypothetical protein WC843_04930 [Candidatus Gracilibacteria bacterium]|jgi:hypothetical protein